MKILPEPLSFVWDAGNIDKNYKKHKVTNKEAEEAFENEPKFIFVDKKHSIAETRYMMWGITNKERRLALIFTMRNDRIRVISARDMHKKERREYEKEIKTNTTI